MNISGFSTLDLLGFPNILSPPLFPCDSDSQCDFFTAALLVSFPFAQFCFLGSFKIHLNQLW